MRQFGTWDTDKETSVEGTGRKQDWAERRFKP